MHFSLFFSHSRRVSTEPFGVKVNIDSQSFPFRFRSIPSVDRWQCDVSRVARWQCDVLGMLSVGLCCMGIFFFELIEIGLCNALQNKFCRQKSFWCKWFVLFPLFNGVVIEGTEIRSESVLFWWICLFRLCCRLIAEVSMNVWCSDQPRWVVND